MDRSFFHSGESLFFRAPKVYGSNKDCQSLRQKDRALYYMILGSKGLSPHELAHKWVKDLRTCPDMSIEVG